MLGELNREQIEALLKSETIVRIGCYADGNVYVVPVTYAYDGVYLYAHSKDGMKIDMMRKNPEVCIEIDAMQNMANWQSVIAKGKFEELTDKESQMKGMKFLIDKLKPLMASETAQPSHGLAHEQDIKGFQAVVFRIKLSDKTGRFEKR